MDHMPLIIILGGLLVLVLVIASIAQRYSDYLEERRRQIGRIMNRVGELENIIQRMAGLPVPAEAEQLIRQDILARLQSVRLLHRRYKDIDIMIQNAEANLNQVVGNPQAMHLNALRVEQFAQLMGELLWLLREKRLVTPVPLHQQEQLAATISLQRADCLYRYHLQEALSLEKRQQLHQAQWHCHQLKQLLEPLVQHHPCVAQWLEEIQGPCRTITTRLKEAQSIGTGSVSSSNGSEIR
jgi:hypothetical protein